MLLSNTDVKLNTSDVSNYEVLLVTGIANPTPMLTYLSELNCNYTHVNFSDHHQFSEKEIIDLQQQFLSMKSENKMILTTEKDFVRLSDKLSTAYYLAIETSFVNGQQEFDELIVNYVNSAL